MHKKLLIRFLLAYFILSMCTPLLVNSIYYVQKFSYYNSGVPNVTSLPTDVYSLLVDYFQDFGLRLRSILMPSLDGYWLAVLALTVGIAVAGATIFANGISKKYRELCDKVERIENGEHVTVKAEGGLFSELEERLGNLSNKSAAEAQARNVAESKWSNASQEAQALLASARAQIEVIVEAGLLVDSSAEKAIAQDALAKIYKAETSIAL